MAAGLIRLSLAALIGTMEYFRKSCGLCCWISGFSGISKLCINHPLKLVFGALMLPAILSDCLLCD
jgi:hypothetical protein